MADRDRIISSKQLEAAGWRRVTDVHLGKLSARYEHRDGWQIQHCGHPTANWPNLLIDPNGEWVLGGAAGVYKNPDYGRAWPTVRQAVDFVATIGKTRRELLLTCRW